MIYVGVDVSKNKHDCCIINQEGEVVSPVFTIWNNKAGFDYLMEKIGEVESDKVDLFLHCLGNFRQRRRLQKHPLKE